MNIGAKINGYQMPNESEEKECSNNFDEVKLSSKRPWGSNNAIASCSGSLEVKSKNLALPVGDVSSEAWGEITISNNSSKENNYYIDLDYSFSLKPGYSQDHHEGGSASGVIEIIANGSIKTRYEYSKSITVSSPTDGPGIVDFTGPSEVAEEDVRFPLTIRPSESLTVKYSISVKSYAVEYYQSSASGKLTVSIDPNPPSPDIK